ERRPPRHLTRRGAALAAQRGGGAARTTAAWTLTAVAAIARLALRTARVSARILRDAALTIEEVAAWAWPIARRLGTTATRELRALAARARQAAEQARSERRREELAR